MKAKPLYIVTITEEYWSAASEETVVHTESFDNFGSMHIWARTWFKTLGVNRTNYKVGKRKVWAKEYVTNKVDVALVFNWYGNSNYSEFTEEKFLAFYYDRIDHLLNRAIYYPDAVVNLAKWGVSVGTIQLQKHEYVCKKFYVKKQIEEWV